PGLPASASARAPVIGTSVSQRSWSSNGQRHAIPPYHCRSNGMACGGLFLPELLLRAHEVQSGGGAVASLTDQAMNRKVRRRNGWQARQQRGQHSPACGWSVGSAYLGGRRQAQIVFRGGAPRGRQKDAGRPTPRGSRIASTRCTSNNQAVPDVVAGRGRASDADQF